MYRRRAAVLSMVFVFLFVGLESIRAEGVRQINFTGELSRRTRGDEDTVLRRFEVTGLLSGGQMFFALLDDPDAGCPWPESFGDASAANAHLTYQFDGNGYNIMLPELMISLPESTDAGTKWSVGDWNYETVEPSGDDSNSLQINVTGRRGRRREVRVESDTGVLLAARQDVFMGQGEQFDLMLTQTDSKQLDPKLSEQARALQDDLLSLQRSLGRRADTQQTGLSARQVEIASQQLEKLLTAADKTPLEATVQRISRDVRRQQKREAGLGAKRDEMVGTDVPGFSLDSVNGRKMSSDSLRGKTVILHFWDYSERSLSEPYGQVAYLDFVLNKARANGPIEVIGVSTAAGLSAAGTVSQTKRSIRKLLEFMNVTYEVGFDDGALLKKLGDPRDADGDLPLWVVVSPAGKIVHYHAGYYEVDRRVGLKALSEAVSAAMQ